MRLLLLLSALLSALGGVVSGGGMARPSAEVSRTADAGTRLVATARLDRRPSVPIARLRDVVSPFHPVAASPIATIPAYASRRRE